MLERDQIDDSSKIKEMMEQSDLIVFASPTYFANVSAFMKLFVDRFCHLTHLFYFAGKPAVVIATSDGRGHTQVLNYLRQFATGLGMNVAGELCSSGSSLSDNSHTRQVAISVAKRLEGEDRCIETGGDLEASFLLWKRIISSRTEDDYEKRYWQDSGLINCNSLSEYIAISSTAQRKCRA